MSDPAVGTRVEQATCARCVPPTAAPGEQNRDGRDADSLTRVVATIRTRGVGAAQAELAAMGQPWAADLAGVLARSAHQLEAAREWDLAGPSVDGGGQLTPASRRVAADVRDTVSDLLVNLLYGADLHTDRVAASIAASAALPRLRARTPPRAARGLLRVLPAGAGQQSCLVGPDGLWLGVTGNDGARIWEVATGRLRLSTDGFAPVAAPDGSWLADRALPGTVRLWRTGEAAPLATIDAADAGHVAAADGSWLATAGYDRTVRLFDSTSGELRVSLPKAGASVFAIPGPGTWLATSRWADVTIRDPARGEPLAVLPHDDTAPVFVEAAAPDGSWLVTGCGDGTLRLWDTGTGALRAVLARDSPYPKGWIVPAHGSWLAATVGDQEIRVWDTATGSALAVLGPTWDQTGAAPATGAWLATPSGRDGPARVWDPDTWQPIATLDGEVRHCLAAPDGSWLATAENDGPIRLWDADRWTVRAELDSSDAVTSWVAAPDGSWLAVLDGFARTVRFWDTRGGGSAVSRRDDRRMRTAERVSSPDGSWVGTLDGGRVTLRDSADDRILGRAGHYGTMRLCEVAPDGRWLVTIGIHANQYGTTADIVTLTPYVEDGERCLSIGEPMELIAGAISGAISPDGRWLATTEWHGPVRIWDTITWSCVTMTWLDDTAWDCGWRADPPALWVDTDAGISWFDTEWP
ncbi:WD40 repeat domain-containing protein [Krasilnikovia sp. MM14-A1259]|uniref:WD40 repeat domain-containing protein n=1 Tax=Krasilnikovia sp. MM14-A1259 TaxID=3373539 RepID=UPI0038020933